MSKSIAERTEEPANEVSYFFIQERRDVDSDLRLRTGGCRGLHLSGRLPVSLLEVKNG